MDKLQKLLNIVDDSVEEIVELEQELVRIPSINTGVMPTGNESEVCDFISDILNKEGITSKLLHRDPGRDNLIVDYPNVISTECKLLLMSHTDVVPVENESKWKYDPFGGEISSGRIYGRGSNDCKSLLTSQLMSMILMNREGVKLDKGLRLISGADEEHGGRWGFGWLLENYPELLKAEYAVNEGGGIPVEIGEKIYYLLGTGEKGRLEVEITIKGESAHASLPWLGVNSSYKLSQVLDLIKNYQPKLDTSLPFFQYMDYFGVEEKISTKNIDQIIKILEQKLPRVSHLSKALSRMTITPTIIEGGIKSNSVPEKIKLICDIRTLPFQDEKYVIEELDKLFDKIEEIDYEIDYMSIPNYSSFDTKLKDSISKAHAKSIGVDEIKLIPSTSNGFTDSRFTRENGTITYGFSGAHPDDDPILANVHGTDESIGISSLVSGTKTMLALAYDLCNSE